MSEQEFQDKAQDVEAKASRGAVNAANGAMDAAADASRNVQAGAQKMGESIARNSADIADKVNAKIKQAADGAEPLVTAARERTSNLKMAFVDEIKSRPLQAVMVAALAGLVIGVLTSR